VVKPRIIVIISVAGLALYYWWKHRQTGPAISGSNAAIPESAQKDFTMPDTSYNAVASFTDFATKGTTSGQKATLAKGTTAYYQAAGVAFWKGLQSMVNKSKAGGGGIDIKGG
jgi:hypothetical protein